jgi:hypothetical protein
VTGASVGRITRDLPNFGVKNVLGASVRSGLLPATSRTRGAEDQVDGRLRPGRDLLRFPPMPALSSNLPLSLRTSAAGLDAKETLGANLVSVLVRPAPDTGGSQVGVRSRADSGHSPRVP